MDNIAFLTPQSNLLSIAQSLISFMDLVVGVLAPLALVIFFVGLVRYIYHGGDTTAHAEAKESITWSLIGLFVLFSVWGILQLLSIAFFNGASGVAAPCNTAGCGPGYYNPGPGGTTAF